MLKKFFLITAVCSVAFLSFGEAGQEFRSFDLIPTPAEALKNQVNLTAEGYQPISNIQKVPEVVVEKVVRDLFGSWNTPSLSTKLAKNFPNKSRIVDSINNGVPRNMELQVLSMQNPRTVEQYIRPHPSGDGSYQLLSKISVSVRSQVADSGGIRKEFVRVEGTSEYLISIVQKVPAT